MVRQSGLVSTICIHDVNLVIASSVGDEGNLRAVWGPRSEFVRQLIVRQVGNAPIYQAYRQNVGPALQGGIKDDARSRWRPCRIAVIRIQVR